MDKDDPRVDGLIRKYWMQYKKIAVILVYLRTVYKVRCGMTWLKKRLKELGLARRGASVQYSSIPDVQHAIERELKGCNSIVGYRQMWRILQTKYSLTVKRSTVQMLLSIMDPDGVARRKGRRLKRRIYQNKRIEGWWSQLRKSVTDWWINLFKDLIQQGKFNPQDTLHRHSLAFTYGRLLGEALEEFKLRWNSHRIRPSRTAGCPPGVPNDLYLLPNMTGTVNYKKSNNFDMWAHCYIEHARKPQPFFPEEFQAAAAAILERDLHLREDEITLENAENVYMHLVNTMSCSL